MVSGIRVLANDLSFSWSRGARPSLAWPRPFPDPAAISISGRGGRREGGSGDSEQDVVGSAGMLVEPEAACNLWYDFRFERVTGFIVDMAGRFKTRLHS